MFIFNFFNLAAEKVHGLEQHIEQLGPVLLRHHVHTLLADQEEQILNPVRYRHQGAELHHSGGTLDGMHDPEYLIDAVLRKRIRLFCRQKDAIQLLQQGISLIQVHIQNAVAHKNATFSHLVGGGSCPREGIVHRLLIIILVISAVSIRKLRFPEKKRSFTEMECRQCQTCLV